ncbi:MAG: benzoyl-CoA reductase, bzd-type, subunit N [Planctomycetes bacterium]|nr:benzoyl-CoA reductase, bzd-type, subunit N [Planctomycetota bacterium]
MATQARLDQETFETFRNWRVNRAQYAQEWKKRTGGKIMGYFCTYAPEELMYAAGILPVRILGSHEVQDVTEPHIFAMFCPFCRDCLAQGLKGKFAYLDGIMIAQSCLHIRQAFTSWQKHIPIDYSYYLPMPHHVQSRHATPFLTKELEVFRASLEQWLGKKIDDRAIDHAIDIYNRNRELMWKVFELRKGDSPPLTGEEAMELVLSSQMVDKEEHNAALESLLGKLAKREVRRPTGTRLMILGSEDDDLAFIRMVESCGATFVIDDHCTGTRYFWNKVERGGDILTDLAVRYVKRVPCPSKDWPKRTRVEHVVKLAKDYDTQGAIVMQQKFCDPHELDNPALIKALHEAGLKTLFLEFDVTVPIGQFKVRVEAFLEMLQEDDLF